MFSLVLPFLCHVLLCGKNNVCAYPSLFFTQDEMSLIQENRTFEDSGKLLLLAIVYCDRHHWSLWINHKIIRPENSSEIEGFQIEEVKPFEVTFSWYPQDSKLKKTFTLRPHQAFIRREQKIIDVRENSCTL